MTTQTKALDFGKQANKAARQQKAVSMILRYLALVLIGLLMLAPFVLATVGTFKTDIEIIAFPPKFFPATWHFENWIKVWNTDIGQGGTFPRWLLNTAFLSVIVAFCQVIFGSMAAYAFARLSFPGRDAIFNFMLGTMMIPGAVTLIPAYVLMTKLHLINTYWSLILPGLVGAGSIFTLTQFFKSIPRDMEEAAVIDGASHLQTFRTVILPLARPAILTVLILNLAELQERLHTLISNRIQTSSQALQLAQAELRRTAPINRVTNALQRLDDLRERLDLAVVYPLRAAERKLSTATVQLQALNPRAVLSRGYAILTDKSSGRVLSSVKTTSLGQQALVQLQDGSLDATINSINPGDLHD